MLYTRSNCRLCDRAHEVLRAISRDYPLAIQTIMIDNDEKLIARFGNSIPVIAFDSIIVAEGRVSEYRLRRHLGTPIDPRGWVGLGRSLLHKEERQ